MKHRKLGYALLAVGCALLVIVSARIANAQVSQYGDKAAILKSFEPTTYADPDSCVSNGKPIRNLSHVELWVRPLGDAEWTYHSERPASSPMGGSFRTIDYKPNAPGTYEMAVVWATDTGESSCRSNVLRGFWDFGLAPAASTLESLNGE